MSCSCIIPFYNEGSRIFGVLKVVTKVPGITEVICVDDGSTDQPPRRITYRYPQVKLIRLERNKGKAGAVEQGLRVAQGEYVLLLDADLKGLQVNVLQRAIDAMKRKADMIILARKVFPLGEVFDRGSLILSGERILETEDLRSLFRQEEVTGFQLEVAINEYMLRQKRRVAWMPTSTVNTQKIIKRGFFAGIAGSFKMMYELISYSTFEGFVRQINLFSRRKI